MTTIECLGKSGSALVAMALMSSADEPEQHNRTAAQQRQSPHHRFG